MTLAVAGECKNVSSPRIPFYLNVSLLSDVDCILGGLSETIPVNRLLALSGLQGLKFGRDFAELC